MIICLVGDSGTLLPTLDKTLAASVIAAMSTAGFAGDKGKSLVLHLENANVLLIGVGKGLKAEAMPRKSAAGCLALLDGLERKRAYVADHRP